ncbi:MAG: Dyp-type peroxidase [Microbacteriaceae bacterium]
MTGDQSQNSSDVSGRRLSRRHLLLGGAAAGVGAVSALAAESGMRAAPTPPTAPAYPTDDFGVVPFFGPHQAGIDTPPQAHAVFIALDLKPEVDAPALARMMRVLTDDAARLTSGSPALADTEPELAETPARTTVTFGFGPGLVERADPKALPTWLRPLPAFATDKLDEAWGGGDVLLQLASNDAVALAHARRMLLKDSRSFANVRWVQTGFRRSPGGQATGTTMRNLFGQLDGSANPQAGTAEFDRVVWGGANPSWLAGGTSFVLRRIAMNLDTWDLLDRSGREASVGRTLDTGAPLTGRAEHDEPDFDAKDALGFPVISAVSHVRRARSDNPAHRIFRRGYNYDEAPAGNGVSDSGLLFATFQGDVDAQFVPIQERLDALDIMNTWTTPVGSAVFAIPPGCAEGSYVGDTLF